MIVLIVLLALILLIFFVPYGVDAAYLDGTARVSVKAGPVRITLYPRRPQSPAQQERARRRREKKAQRNAEKAAKKEAQAQQNAMNETQKVPPKRKLDLDFLMALLRMAAHAMRRVTRSFTIDFLQIHYTVATHDPYDTAMQYGYLCAALNTLPALFAGKVRLLRKDIQIGMDFESETPRVEGRLVLTVQLFRIVHVAVAFAAEFIQWKIKRRKNEKAGAIERTDDNGREQDQRNHGCDHDQDQAVG